MMEKVKLTVKQAEMIKNHEGHLRDLMFKWRAKGCSTFIDDLTAEQVLDAYFDGYEVEPEYKIGDWVTIVSKNSKEGEIFELIGKRDEGVYLLKMAPASNMLWHVEEFRHATPEEIKAEQERRLWAGIGREVNHWRIGDIFITSEKVFKVDGNKNQIGHASMAYESGYVTGFYPAESFIKFEEESK